MVARELLLWALLARRSWASTRPLPVGWRPAGSWPPLPSPREDAPAAYAPQGDVLAMFGGKDADGNILANTLLLNVTSRTWTEVNAAATGPPNRFSAIMAAVRDGAGTYEQLVMLAGEGLDDSGKRVFYNDAWALCTSGCTGSSGPAPLLVWRRVPLTGASGTPPGRYGTSGGSYVDSAGRGVFLMTHGFDGGNRWDDTWALTFMSRDEAVWHDVSPPDSVRPYARCLHVGTVVSDTSLVRMPMFGGCGTGGYGPCPDRSGGWIFERSVHGPPEEAGAWRPVPSGARPRLLGAMAFLPEVNGTAFRPRVLMYGGTGGTVVGADPPDQVAVLDISTGSWANFKPTGTGPQETIVKVSMVAVDTAQYTDLLLLGGQVGGAAISTVHSLYVHTGQAEEKEAWGGGSNLPAVHGTLMLLAWGILVPIGVTAARFGRTPTWLALFGANWFFVHRFCNGLAVILSTIACIVAILMVATAHFLARPHAQLGLTVVLLGVLQPLNAFFRPEPPSNKSPRRVRWEVLHKTLGRIACVLGAANPFWGLAHLSSPQGGAPLPLALYSTWIGGLILFWIVNSVRGRPGSEPDAEYKGDQPLSKTGLCPCLGKSSEIEIES